MLLCYVRYLLEIPLYLASTLLLLIIFSTNFVPKRIYSYVDNSPFYPTLLNNIIVNVGLITCLTYPLVVLNLKPKNIFLIIMVIMFLSAIKNINQVWNDILSNLRELTIINLISLWAILPALIKSIREYSIFNMASIMNNDINAYSFASEVFLESGSLNINKLVDTNLNSFAVFTQHQVPNILTAFISFTYQLPTWRVMNTTLGFIIALSLISVRVVVKLLLPHLREKSTYTIPIILVLSPIMTYIFGNYFLGQAFAFTVSMATFAVTLRVHITKKINISDFIQIVFLVLLCFYSYPIFLIPFGICCIIWYTLFNIKEIKKSVKIFFSGSMAIFAGTVLASPYIVNAFSIFLLLNRVEAGWSIPPLNPISLFIFGDLLRAFPLQSFFFTFSWFLFFVFAVFTIFSSKNLSLLNNKNMAVIFFSIISGLVIILMQRQFDLSLYKNWKIISFFIPFIYLILILKIADQKKYRFLYLSAIILSLASPVTTWRHGFTGKEMVVTKDLASLYSSERISNLDSINIELDPFFETMAAAQIVQVPQVYLVSNQYWTRSSSEKSCTLVRNDNRINDRTEKINSTYGLIPSKDRNCQIQNSTSTLVNIDMNESDFYTKSFVSREFLVKGWGDVEKWGVWSIDDESEIAFELLGKPGSKFILTIEGNVYFPLNREVVNISILLNDKNVGNYSFNNVKNVIRIPIFLNEGKKLIKVHFKIENPISPASQNLSQDTRNLGLGLEKIEIRKQVD